MNELKEEQTPQKKKFDWGIFWFWLISTIIIIIFVFSTLPNRPKVWINKVPKSCSRNIFNLMITIVDYSADHKGHYPQNLEVLKTLGYIENLPSCTESNNQYIYQIENWDSSDFTIWCPNPEKHNLKSKYYHHPEGILREE